jgi:hypothetical protein
MNVRLNEAGQQVRTAGIDDSIGAGIRQPDRLDAPVANHDITVDDVEGVVHGDDGRVADR